MRRALLLLAILAGSCAQRIITRPPEDVAEHPRECTTQAYAPTVAGAESLALAEAAIREPQVFRCEPRDYYKEKPIALERPIRIYDPSVTGVVARPVSTVTQ